MQVKEVSDLRYALPENIIGVYLPQEDEIPKEFYDIRNPWNIMAERLYFEGVTKPLNSKEGIDPNKALRQILTCLRSLEPKHEHKIAGVAYMLSLWFEQENSNEPAR